MSIIDCKLSLLENKKIIFNEVKKIVEEKASPFKIYPRGFNIYIPFSNNSELGTIAGKLKSVGTEIQKFIKNDDILKNHNLFKWDRKAGVNEYIFEFYFPESLKTIFKLKEHQENVEKLKSENKQLSLFDNDIPTIDEYNNSLRNIYTRSEKEHFNEVGDVFSSYEDAIDSIRNITTSEKLNRETEKIKRNETLIFDSDLLTKKSKNLINKLISKTNNLNVTYNSNEGNSFDNDTNTININIYEIKALSNLSGLPFEEVLNITVVHEYAHAAFEYILKNNPEIYAKFRNFHKMFLDHVDKNHFNDRLRNNLGLDKLYQKDIYEFIADAFSNPDVINILKQMKDDDGTFWYKFKKIISDFLNKFGISVFENLSAYGKLNELLDTFTNEDNIQLNNEQDFDFEVKTIRGIVESKPELEFEDYRNYNNAFKNLFTFFKDTNSNFEFTLAMNQIYKDHRDYFNNLYSNKEFSEKEKKEFIDNEINLMIDNLNLYINIADASYTKFINLLEIHENLKNDPDKIKEYGENFAKLANTVKYFQSKSFSNLNINLLIQLAEQSGLKEFNDISKDLKIINNNINNMNSRYKTILNDLAIFESNKILVTDESNKNLDYINSQIKETEEQIKLATSEELIKRLNLKLDKLKEDRLKSDVKTNILSTYSGKGGFKSITSAFSKTMEAAYNNSNIAVAAVTGLISEFHLLIKEKQVNISNIFQSLQDNYFKTFNVSVTDTKHQKWMSMEVEEFKTDENGDILLNDGVPVVVKTKYLLHDVNEKFYEDYNKKRAAVRLIKEEYKKENLSNTDKILLNSRLSEASKDLRKFENTYIVQKYDNSIDSVFDILDETINGVSINSISINDCENYLERKRKFSQNIKGGSRKYYDGLLNEYYELKRLEIQFKNLIKSKGLEETYKKYKDEISNYFTGEKEVDVLSAKNYIDNVINKLKKDGESKEKIEAVKLELESLIYINEIKPEFYEKTNKLKNQKDLLMLQLEAAVKEANEKLTLENKLSISNEFKTKIDNLNNLLNKARNENGEVNINRLTEEEKKEIEKLDQQEAKGLKINNLYQLLTDDSSDIKNNYYNKISAIISQINDVSKEQRLLWSSSTTQEYDNILSEIKTKYKDNLLTEEEYNLELDKISFQLFTFDGVERVPFSYYKISLPSDKNYYTQNRVNSKYFGKSEMKINSNFNPDQLTFTDKAKTDYANQKFLNIANTSAADFLKLLTNLYFKAQKNTKYKNKYRLPSVAKSDIDRLLGKEFNSQSIKDGTKEFFTESINKLEELTGIEDHNFEFNSIPTMYSSLLESDKMTDNFIAAIYLFTQAAESEKVHRENYYKIDAIIKSSENKIDNNSFEQIKNIVSTHIFGNKEISKSDVEFLLNRAADKVMAISAFKSFALNIPSQAVNFINAKVTTAIHQNSDMMSTEDWKYGEKEAVKQMGHEFKDEFRAGNLSKMGQFAQMMGLKDIRQKQIDSRGIKKWNLKLLSFLKNLVESELFYSLLYAFSNKHKVNIKGKSYRFHELYELVQIIEPLTKIKYQELRLRNDLNLTEEELILIENTKKLFYKDFTFNYTKINGNFLGLNSTEIERVWYGRLIVFMRKYVVPFMTERFYTNKRYNHYSSKIEEGFYVIFMKALLDDIKSFGFQISKYSSTWTKEEKQAAIKVLKEFSAVMLMMGIAFMFGYGDDYDPEEDEEFLNFKWWQNHLLYVILKTQSEISTFVPMVGLREQANTFTTFSVASGSINQWVEVLKLFRDTVIQDEDAFFKSDQNYWQEGQPKIWKHLLKQIGVNGNLYYSDQGIEGYRYSQRAK